MNESSATQFDLTTYLTTAGLGRKIVRIRAKQAFFTQGSHADSVFYLQIGRAKLTVVSKNGKEATITLIGAGEFIGDEAIVKNDQRRMATATAVTSCIAIKIDRVEMVRVLSHERDFSQLFLKALLKKSMRTQDDLIDQLFNSAEKRLARTLLLMAEYGGPGEPDTLIPSITQETLAEMIGTTRSRVSFFMNRFRELGYIEYKGRIRVHKSLLNAVLTDHLPDENSKRPNMASRPSAGQIEAGRRGHVKSKSDQTA